MRVLHPHNFYIQRKVSVDKDVNSNFVALENKML